MEEFEGFIFDLDGVLVDTTPLHREAYLKAFARYDVTLPPYFELAGRSTREVVMSIFADRFETSMLNQMIAAKQAYARQLFEKGVQPLPGAIELIRALSARKNRLAVATSASRSNASLLLKSAGFSDFFSIVVTADDVSRAKPDPEIFLRAAAGIAVVPEKALVFEDSIAGVQAAKKAGMSVWMIGEKKEKNKLSGIRDQWFPSLLEVFHFFKKGETSCVS